MRCPKCDFDDTQVKDSRLKPDNTVKRRRICPACDFRFYTYESFETPPLLVLKKNHSIEHFNKEKLIDRILRATAKRNVPLEVIENAVDNIYKEFQKKAETEVSSQKIGEMVLFQLKNIDEVAYIRFASVYRDFSDAKSFVKIINEFELPNV